jgi:hypothetical protein
VPGYDFLDDSAGVIMKRFVTGADRGQSTLLPECLDDWIDEENPVRAIDAFVDVLDCPPSAPIGQIELIA